LKNPPFIPLLRDVPGVKRAYAEFMRAGGAKRFLTPFFGTSSGEYLRLTGEYQATLKKYPNPPGFSMTKFKK
jgi:hypothetical protein